MILNETVSRKKRLKFNNLTNEKSQKQVADKFSEIFREQ